MDYFWHNNNTEQRINKWIISAIHITIKHQKTLETSKSLVSNNSSLGDLKSFN